MKGRKKMVYDMTDEPVNTASDSGPAEKLIVWTLLIAGCLAFWAVIAWLIFA